MRGEEESDDLLVPGKDAAAGECPPLQPHIYCSEELLKGAREVWIEHNSQMYRLRLTSNGRLYLTK